MGRARGRVRRRRRGSSGAWPAAPAAPRPDRPGRGAAGAAGHAPEDPRLLRRTRPRARPMTYPEAVARILGLRGGERVGMRPGLERIEALLDATGRPERAFTIAQVGGTNGKGSISAMLAAILQAAGRRLGVTVFEAGTALALDHFCRSRVDVAVLEVGLGGRLDATTVGRPEVVVLGPIDYDHKLELGDTLTAIAGEKAAIIRSGVAFSARQDPEAARSSRTRAASGSCRAENATPLRMIAAFSPAMAV